jgi:hypothetical protein
MQVSRALKEWEAKNEGKPIADATEVQLYGGCTIDGKRVFVNKLDASLATLKSCECVTRGRVAASRGRCLHAAVAATVSCAPRPPLCARRRAAGSCPFPPTS